MHASKGFSYLVPKTVQNTLSTLLKKLPFAARSIYREYYGDIMAFRLCAADSSKAMIAFVTNSFFAIMLDYNCLAELMNAEIMLDEYDGYDSILLPIISDGPDESDSKEEAATPPNVKNAYSTKVQDFEPGSPTSLPSSTPSSPAPQVENEDLLHSAEAVDVQQETAGDVESGRSTSSLSSAPTSPIAPGENDGSHYSASAESSGNAMDIDDHNYHPASSGASQPSRWSVSTSGASGAIESGTEDEDESEDEVDTPNSKKRRATTPPNAYNVRRKFAKVHHPLSPAVQSSPTSTSVAAREDDEDAWEDLDDPVTAEDSDSATGAVQDDAEAPRSESEQPGTMSVSSPIKPEEASDGSGRGDTDAGYEVFVDDALSIMFALRSHGL
jgi:hypothetical protein